MNTNAFVTLPMAAQPKVRPIRPPRGNLIEMGINPFTYKIILSYQSNKVCLQYLDQLIKQLYEQIMMMPEYDYPPTIEGLIEFLKDGNVPPQELVTVSPDYVIA